jgi:hypothetical protein
MPQDLKTPYRLNDFTGVAKRPHSGENRNPEHL